MNFLRRTGIISASATVFILMLFSFVYADFVPRVEVKSGEGNAPAVLLVNNRIAVRFMVPNGGLTPTKRAIITADRLRAMVSAGTNWATIKTKPGNASVLVSAGERPICVVTRGDARANGCNQKGLAKFWASRLRNLLRMPPITLSMSDLLIPLGESRTCEIGGAAVGPIAMVADDCSIAVPEVTPDGGSLRIQGQAIGDTTIRVTREGNIATIVAHIRKYAGHYKDGPPVEVTGEPAPGSLLQSLTEQFAASYIDAEPGARVDIGTPKLEIDSLERGKSTIASIPVSITGADYIATAFNATVTLTNRPLMRKPTAALLYSNDPEQVTKYGQLYAAKIALDAPARLLYHHQNRIGKRMRLDISLININDSPAKVQIIKGVCSPMVDTVVVGYCAGSQFLKDYLGHVGYIVTIPAHSRLVLLSQMLNPINTGSGIVEFRELEGSGLIVKVAADMPETAGIRAGDMIPVSMADANVSFSEHVYPLPVKKVEVKYVFGQNWAFIGFGKYPIKDEAANRKLFGNYGVIYEIKLQISNPTSLRQKVILVFEPVSGLASGVFYINGKFVEIKHAMPPNEFTIAVFNLKPQQTIVESILTMPLSGSAYPANILVRPF